MKLWLSKLSRPVRFARQDSSPSLPICAVSCVDPAATSIGCSGTDASCICNNQTAFGNAISSCLIQACTASDISAATAALAQLCADVSAPSPTSSIASGVVSSASSAAASAASSTLPSALSLSSPTSSSASGTPASTTSSTATAAGRTSPSSSVTTQPGTPSSSTATSTPGAPPPALSTGATAGIAVGAVLGFILLALAALIVWRRRRAATNRAVTGTHDDGGPGPPELASSKVPTHHELAHDPNAKYGMSPGSQPSELAPNPEKNQALEHELSVDPAGPMGLQSSFPSDNSYLGRGTNAELDGTPVSAAPNPHTASLGQVEQSPFGGAHPGPGAASTMAEYSDAPEVVGPDPNEINYIHARAAELEAQRQTLLHLRSVEEEQEALRVRLAHLQQNK